MSITSVGQQGPVSPTTTNNQVQNKPQQTQTASSNPTNTATKPNGAQPLNASGRGQVVNLVV